MALPTHVKPDRFMRAAFTAINVVPRLAECTQNSVLAGLMQAAQLGLEVADVRGQCYLIPRKNNRAGGVYEATFQLGYRGMIDLAARSGITVDAEELHENDEYEFSLGTSRYLQHRPTLDARGKVLAYYATASFADRRVPAFTIMSVHEIEEHRDRFASQRDGKGKIAGPWVEHFDAMARKTVIRSLLNYLPVAVELRDAIHADAIETTEQIGAIDYGSTFTPPDAQSPPEGIDAVTGEVADPLAVTETTAVDSA
jgi:recombination protein RecT